MKKITREEAFELYCKGRTVYFNGRRLPASGEFSSHAPACQLFYRCLHGELIEYGTFETND